MKNSGKWKAGEQRVNLNQALKEVKKQMRAGKKKNFKKTVEKNEEVQSFAEIKPEIFKGTGKVLVSGTTVHGVGTSFIKELKQGDFLVFQNPVGEERRKVVLVLSDKSALLGEGFDTDKNSEFLVESWPKVEDEGKEVNEEEEIRKKRKLALGEEVYEVRVKRGPWTYKVDTVRSKDGMSHEELLNVRAQRVRDKFCWM